MFLKTRSNQMREALDLKALPISITFTRERPTDIRRINTPAVSGCCYWKLASEGATFYTESTDHYGCPIGAYTHKVELPAEQGKELEGMIEKMVTLTYLKMEEVAAIARREEAFRFAIYGALADARVPPDVVIVRGNAKQIMLIAEATNAAGTSSLSEIRGRPRKSSL